jgi:hypothetical protein
MLFNEFNMIREFDVTSNQSIEYFRQQLDLSGKMLSNQLLKLKLESGKIFSIVPEFTTDEKLQKFNSGGIYKSDQDALKRGVTLIEVQNDSKPELLKSILNYLPQNSNNCCVFEESVGKPNDEWVKSSKIEYVKYEDEMYYFFTQGNQNKLKIERAINRSGSYYFLCVLSIISAVCLKFSREIEISSNIFNTISQNVHSIYVRAYDGEGFLKWKS